MIHVITLHLQSNINWCDGGKLTSWFLRVQKIHMISWVRDISLFVGFY